MKTSRLFGYPPICLPTRQTCSFSERPSTWPACLPGDLSTYLRYLAGLIDLATTCQPTNQPANQPAHLSILATKSVKSLFSVLAQVLCSCSFSLLWEGGLRCVQGEVQDFKGNLAGVRWPHPQLVRQEALARTQTANLDEAQPRAKLIGILFAYAVNKIGLLFATREGHCKKQLGLRDGRKLRWSCHASC